MSIIKHYPAAKLPDDLRGDIPLDAYVEIQITDESQVEASFDQDKIDRLLEPSLKDKKEGLGVRCKTKEEGRLLFEDIKQRGQQRQSKSAAC